MKKASKNSTYKKVNRFSTEIDAFILLKDCVKIIAPYKAAAEYVKVTYSNIIESAIAMQLKDKITVSYGYIETDTGDSSSI